jgi:hypothetical protein
VGLRLKGFAMEPVIEFRSCRGFVKQVWTFASGGDLLGGRDSIDVPHAHGHLRE